MSRFLSKKYADLVPYVPGEQPRDRSYIKLNTNESPFAPSRRARREASKALARLALYPDPTMKALREEYAATLGVAPEQLLATNGSDEILNFAFSAFCDADTPAVFPDITYGFYRVFADLDGIPTRVIPLDDELRIRPEEYYNAGGTVFIANPNAPTGIALSLAEVERYPNLLVTHTFSKSRSMAGARLGFGIASAELIRDMDAIKYSTNPYNVNGATAALGIGTLRDAAYTKKNCETVAATREYVLGELRALGFECTPSVTNFVFCAHHRIGGEALYLALRARGFLVRHFTTPRIADYNRITVGSREEMEALCHTVRIILEELS